MRRYYLLACLLMSGCAGLSYELVWVRLLAVSFGSTTLSFATVLAVFFGGLALGAWLAGRYVARVARPARAYGIVELGTGVAGLALYPVLLQLGDVFALIDPGPGLLGALVRLLVSLPLLLVPTVLMGATLPLVTRAVVVESRAVGRGSALIYGFNTLGAFLGVYLTTYFLLDAFGLFGVNLVAVVLNVVVGAIVVIVERITAALEVAPAPKVATRAASKRSLTRRQIAAVVLTTMGGFAAIALQVVWARMFSVFLNGTIYGIGAVLIAVLIGIAVGAIAAARFADNERTAALVFVALQVLTVLAVAGQVALLPWIAYVLGDPPVSSVGGMTTLHAQLAITLAVLLIPTTCSGASFPLLVRIFERTAARAGESLGSLYAANTVGSILGSLVTGFLLLPLAGSVAALFLAVALVATVGALAAVFLPRRVPRVARLGLALIAVASVGTYQGYDSRMLSARPSAPIGYKSDLRMKNTIARKSVYFAEGEVATVLVTDSAHNRALLLNGLGQGSFKVQPPHYNLESFLVGLVPIVHTRPPDETLVIGLGAGATVRTLREATDAHVTVVELEPRVVDAVRVMYDGAVTEDPGVTIEINDARHYLSLNRRGDRRFDIITSMPAHPWVASTIFTTEFFATARANLAPGGVFCTWFGANGMGRQEQAALLRSFTAAFDHYVVYFVDEIGAFLVVGSRDPITIDLAYLEELWQRPVVRSNRRAISTPMAFLAKAVASGTKATPSLPPGPEHTDDHPVIELRRPLRGFTSETRFNLPEDFFPNPSLTPEMVPPPQRVTLFVQLIEQLMGTPGGEFNFDGRVALRYGRARRTLEAARGFLTPDTVRYFEARLALHDGSTKDRERHHQTLEEIGRGEDRLAERARRFGALLQRDKEVRLVQLAALERYNPGVIVWRLALGDTEALRDVPAEEPDARTASIAWLLWAVAHGKLDDKSRILGTFFKYLGPALRTAGQLELHNICIRFSERFSSPWVLRTCSDWRDKLEDKALDEGRRRAHAAGRRGDYVAAVGELRALRVADPTNPLVIELLVWSLAAIDEWENIPQLLRELRFIGRAEARVDDLARRLQRATPADVQAHWRRLGRELTVTK